MLFVLVVSTQAGTYVKEFVYGDFRRTRTSLREPLQREMDIMDVKVGRNEKDKDADFDYPTNIASLYLP